MNDEIQYDLRIKQQEQAELLSLRQENAARMQARSGARRDDLTLELPNEDDVV